MKNSRYFAAAFAAAALCILAQAAGTEAGETDGISIVTTIYPEYDWVMNILGENPGGVQVTALMDSGVDLHSYQPTAKDILTISTCDLFVYIGGESDSWVDGALEEAVNKDMVVVSLLDTLGDSAREEEIVEGMQEEEHDHDHGDDHEDEHEDEHVWLSLRSASVLTQALAEAVAGLDPENADLYRSNAAAYTEKLAALDEEYAAAVEAAPVKTLLFGDRFPFRYLVDDYGIDYYAAFAGCSAETEASFETITFLAGKVDELSLSAIMTIDGSDQRIAQTIAGAAKAKDLKILTLDSMQSASSAAAEEGMTYLSVMEENLAVLKEALQ